MEKLIEKLHKRNITKFGLDINPIISGIAITLIIIFIILGLIYGIEFIDKMENLQSIILHKFKFIYIFFIAIIVPLIILLSISKIGKIRLGGIEAKPKHSRFSWYSMLFSAGMGIGLIFYGVVEPLSHYGVTPLFDSTSKSDSALATTFYHWGIQGWAVYALVGLSLAYFTYNKKLPMSPRVLFYPILKEKTFGYIGDIIDGLAVFVTLIALASSLGIGALQVNSGLNYLLGIDISVTIQIIIIIIITLFASLSLISGLDKGIRILSELNVYMAILLMVVVFLLGPTLLIITNVFGGSLLYFKMSFYESISSYGANANWLADWTLFYWAWWASWSMFVGMFIAKVSYGRTVCDFLLSTILIPTFFCIFWFSIMGTTAIDTNIASGNELMNIINTDYSLGLYAMFNLLVNSKIILIFVQSLSLMLIISFFVTSSDSGSLVVDGLTSGGKMHSPLGQKIFWASIEGALAIILIILGGHFALDLIQNVLIIVSLPMVIIISVAIVTLVYELYKDAYKNKK